VGCVTRPEPLLGKTRTHLTNKHWLLPIAGIIGLTECKNVAHLWRAVFLWSFPNCVNGAGLSGIAATLTTSLAWKVLGLERAQDWITNTETRTRPR